MRTLLLLLFLITTTTVFSQQANDYRLQGDTSFKNKHYATARKYYTEAIDSNVWNRSDLANVYFKRGQCDDYLNDFNKSISDYTIAINDQPDLKLAYWSRGSAYQRINNFQQSISDYKKSILYFDPEDNIHISYLYDNIANVEFRIHEIDSALQYCSAAIMKGPNLSAGYATKGRILMYLKKYPEAIACFDRAIENTSDDNKTLLVEYYLQRGNAKNLNKHSKDAIKDFDYVIKIDPENKEANWNRAYGYSLAKDFKAAVNYYTQIMPLFKGDNIRMASLYRYRAGSEFELNLYADAIADDSVSISLNPDVEPVYLHMASVCSANGDDATAIAKCRIALTFGSNSRGENSNIYTEIGYYEYRRKNDMEAITNFNKAIELNAQNYYSYFCRGRLYLNHIKNKDLATADFNKVLDIDTTRKSHDYIFALFYTGKQTQAIAIIQQKLAPADNKIAERNEHFDLACMYAMLDDKANACEHLETAINDGFSVKLAIADDDLENVRNTDEYKRLTGDGK